MVKGNISMNNKLHLVIRSILPFALLVALALPALANQAPIASITANPSSGNSPLEVIFDASASYDTDGWIVRFEWDLNGDGSFTLDSGTFPFVYAYFALDSSATINTSVRVTDALGATATAATQITVSNGVVTTNPQTETTTPAGDNPPLFPLIVPPSNNDDVEPSSDQPQASTTQQPTSPDLYANDSMTDGDWLHACYAPIPARTAGARSYQNEQIARMTDEVLAIVNRERSAAGLNPLKWGFHLELVAQAHARDMALRGYFDHTNLYGMGPSDRINATNPPQWNYVAENIAAGNQTVQDVVAGWMDSPGHRANILNPEVDYLGVGCYYLANDQQHYGYYWVQVFASFFKDPSGHDWLDPNEVK